MVVSSVVLRGFAGVCGLQDNLQDAAPARVLGSMPGWVEGPEIAEMRARMAFSNHPAENIVSGMNPFPEDTQACVFLERIREAIPVLSLTWGGGGFDDWEAELGSVEDMELLGGIVADRRAEGEVLLEPRGWSRCRTATPSPLPREPGNQFLPMQ